MPAPFTRSIPGPDARRLRLALVAFLAATPAMAQTFPFEGAWDCGVGTFTFTADLYDPGGNPMPIMDVAEEDGNFILTFADDYQIGLSSVTDTTMQWLSFASGDMFDCQRLD